MITNYKQFKLNSTGDLHSLKLVDEEGSETMWLSTKQLQDLRDFLNTLELDEEDDESIIK